MCFKIDWASLIVGRKFTLFAFFYLEFEGKFPSTAPPRGGYLWRGDLTEGFCVTSLGALYLEGLIHDGWAYFRNFTVFPLLNLQSLISYSHPALLVRFLPPRRESNLSRYMRQRFCKNFFSSKLCSYHTVELSVPAQ